MNKTIVTVAHNPKNAIIVPAAQVIELGSVTKLTLGYVGNLAEHSRPNAWTSGGTKI